VCPFWMVFQSGWGPILPRFSDFAPATRLPGGVVTTFLRRVRSGLGGVVLLGAVGVPETGLSLPIPMFPSASGPLFVRGTDLFHGAGMAGGLIAGTGVEALLSP